MSLRKLYGTERVRESRSTSLRNMVKQQTRRAYWADIGLVLDYPLEALDVLYQPTRLIRENSDKRYQ